MSNPLKPLTITFVVALCSGIVVVGGAKLGLSVLRQAAEIQAPNTRITKNSPVQISQPSTQSVNMAGNGLTTDYLAP